MERQRRRRSIDEDLSDLFDSESEDDQDLDPEELIPWTVVINSRHAGTLSCLRKAEKDILQDSFYTWLREKTGKQTVKDFEVEIKGKPGPALPRKWVEDFNDWLDDEIEDGLLDRTSKKKKRKIVSVAVCTLFEEDYLESTQSKCLWLIVTL